MAGYHFYAQTTLRGYHAYKDIVVTLGKIFVCEPEPSDVVDKFAVVVKVDGENIAGHLPIKIALTLHKFLIDSGQGEAEVTGCRFNEGADKGLEIATDITCIGPHLYVKSLRKKLMNIIGKKVVSSIAPDRKTN
eukprot:gene1567-1728_t